MKQIQDIILSSIDTKREMVQDENILTEIQKVAELIVEMYHNEGQLFLCGNGGSASDAQHIAAELTGRFYFDRAPLNAEALSTNISHLTAVANDYSFDEIYARMLKAKARKDDVLIAISTSGNSQNILRTAQEAKEADVKVVGFTGKDGGKLANYCDYLINIPSIDTPRIQEAHILVGHILCEIVESTLFPR